MFESLSSSNNFCKKWIIVRRYNHSLIATTIKSYSHTHRWSKHIYSSRVRHKSLFRIFGSNSALNCKSMCLNIFLLHVKILKWSSTSNHNLSLHNIYSSNFFSYCMLNLDSWINFNKVKFTSIIFNQKFNCSSIFIFDRFS